MDNSNISEIQQILETARDLISRGKTLYAIDNIKVIKHPIIKKNRSHFDVLSADYIRTNNNIRIGYETDRGQLNRINLGVSSLIEEIIEEFNDISEEKITVDFKQIKENLIVELNAAN